MDRVKQQATGTYTFESEYTNDDGVVTHITTPVSVTIRDGAGTTIYTGTPTLHGNHLDITIPVATLPTLDTYEFTWTGTISSTTVTWTSDVELVGGYLFEIADLRNADRAFTDTAKYPTDVLKQVRTWVEDVIEGTTAANVAFVPRGNRVTLDGSNRYKTQAWGIDVPDFELRQVFAAKVNGTALTNAQVTGLICDDNTVWRTDTIWQTGHQNVQLHYSHGFDRAPGAITRAALLLAREYLVKSDLPSRATATSIGDQLFRLTIAGRDGITGLPDVDAAIAQFGRRGYKIG